MPAIWNNTTKKGVSSSDNPKESADELWESATGATKTTSKTVEPTKQEETTPVKKTLKQRLIENAPAFKRGVDSFITGIANNRQQNTQRTTPNRKIERRNTRSFNPFQTTSRSNNSPFEPFTPISGSNRKSSGPFSGGDFDFIGGTTEKSTENKPVNTRKKSRKQRCKTSGDRDIHIHIHKK